MRGYLRRKLQSAPAHTAALTEVLEWVLDRQARFDKKAGGLGQRKKPA